MSDPLKRAAYAAGLSDKEMRQIESLNKSLNVHRELLNLPPKVANAQYNKLTAAQQQDLKARYGTEDPVNKEPRGWLGTAWHYTGGAAFRGITEISDLVTRTYRAAAIPLSRGEIGFAWEEANDKGDKVFNQGRIADARAKFGAAQVNVAMRLAAGEKASSIANSATEEEQQYVRLFQSTQGKSPDELPAEIRSAQEVFQDTLAAVDAAKFSPGRQLANLVTPKQFEGQGFFYKAVSGVTDAIFRIAADPLIIAGKAKKLYDISKYSLDVVVGGNKVDEVFDQANVQNFWNRYGSMLDNYKKARTDGNAIKMRDAKNELRVLAPEFGDSVIDSFIAGDAPIMDALTAKAFFKNAENLQEIMKGSIGRRRVLMPRLDRRRQTRVNIVTSVNKVINLDKIGPGFVDDLFFGGSSTTDGIAERIINNQKEIAEQLKAGTKSKGVAYFSMDMIRGRIDKFKARFTAIPFFPDNVFDVTAKDAPRKMYQMARLIMPQREAKLLSEAFAAMPGTGQRKDVYYGLMGTIGEVRGIRATSEGQRIGDEIMGKTKAVHAVDDTLGNPSVLPTTNESVALIPSDTSPFVTTPSITDLDRAAARTGWIQRVGGLAHKDWVNKMTSYWSFLTLAGPRYAIRNATEDLMVNLAIGQSVWGVGTAKLLSTRLRTARQLTPGMTKAEIVANNPLGIIMRYVNKSEAEAYTAEINKIIDEGGGVKEIRQVFARALNEGKARRFMGKFTEEDRAVLAEQIIHGDLDNALMDVVEGGKFAFTGLDYSTKSLIKARRSGVRLAEFKAEYPSNIRRARGAGFRRQDPLTDEASKVAWLMRINYYANDEVGAIAVANLDNKDKAVAEIAQWFRDNPKVYNEFRWKDAGVTIDEHAERVYRAARQLFVKADDSINLDLLSKVRTLDPETGGYKVGGRMTIDDLPTTEADAPKWIVGPSLVPISETGEFTASLMEKGWDWLGEANARLSREPIVLAEMIETRKNFKKTGFEDAFIKAHLREIDPTNVKAIEKATLKAKQKLAEIVEDRARLQTLAYVDNPMVQSQFAWSIRNFARFYRATEDFYRRMYRVVRYNPDAIVKASLVYEGIGHSGWIKEDDQGEKYFIYPGMVPVYRAVQTALTGLGVPTEFKMPLPVEFGARLNMITPSLNPDSLVPTFAGPAAAVPLKVIANITGIFSPGAADRIERFGLGKYAVDQPMISAFLPAHINRIYNAMDRDERDSQYASAWRKAVTYLEAAGHGIPKKYDADGNLIAPSAGELEEYRLRVKNTTIAILGTRAIFGFFAPASPMVMLKSDVNDFVRENGEANFKQVWYGLLESNPGDYDAAMEKWVKLFPDQIPFTVSESERKTVAYFRYAQESGDFVDTNSELFGKYPQGAAFLIPHKAGYSWDAYKTMTDMGLRQNKRVADHLREVQTAADLQTYYERREAYEQNLERVATDFERSQLREEFSKWKEIFFAGRPLVAEELSQGSQKAIERVNALNDLEALLSDKKFGNVAKPTQDKLREMLTLYKAYKDDSTLLEAFPGGTVLKNAAKDSTIVKMRELAKFNENTQSAYDMLFARLLGE